MSRCSGWKDLYRQPFQRIFKLQVERALLRTLYALISFVAKLGTRVPSLDKEGKAWPQATAGVVRNVGGKAKSVSGSQRFAPPQWRSAPHPLLSRGGESSCNLPVS